ncbi:polysaccharide biosynthesis/export family protein [Sphingomonas crocodyli]|uniref:Polysaccharide export protein n=1 Tax=Sphingomonas crocodyli TaxID=1979270 RepID=A0A437LXR4_9SPHN|nr:polysaccharide biosynthesis/export family protein [Sphingomonas crocodyli]RVT90152.1 polysaccharide export protein [Sphingomonas crocodyli]
MPRNLLHAHIVLGMIVATAGCSTAPLMAPDGPQALAYRLDAGDKVRLTMFNDPSISGEFAVTPEGDLSLPLIGNVSVRGKTLEETTALVTERFASGYVKDPRMTLEVLNYRPYYILGEVSRAGAYPFSAGLTVEQAVAAAGGFSYRANKRYVFIKRASDPVERRVDVKNSRTYVLPGDTLRIGERYF